MKVTIAAERCTGHGRCYTIAPVLFSDDERGFGEVIGAGDVAAAHEDVARAAVAACPEHAVVLGG